MSFDAFIDKDTNDLVFENGTIRLTSSKPELLRQRLNDVFKTWRGEWFNDITYGAIDRDILFVHGVTKAEIDAWFKIIVNSFEEVNSIALWESEIDFINRTYDLDYVVRTDFGDVAGFTTTVRPDIEVDYVLVPPPSDEVECEFDDLPDLANRLHAIINNAYPRIGLINTNNLLISSPNLITGSNYAAVSRSVDTQGDKGNNHRRSWWNSSQSRWDGIIRTGSGSEGYLFSDLTGTPTDTGVAINVDTATGRADAVWDETNDVLYIVNWDDSGTTISSYDYTSGTDTYASGSLDEVVITGITSTDANTRGSFAIDSTDNIWVAVVNENGLTVQRSQDDGATWLASAVLLNDTLNTGQVDISFATDSGDEQVVIMATEAGGGGDIKSITANTDDLTLQALIAWTTETIPSLSGTATFSDQVHLHEKNNVIYAAVKAQDGEIGSSQSMLFTRATGGTWTGYTVYDVGAVVTESIPDRPVVITDSDTIYYITSRPAVEGGNGDIEVKRALISSPGDIESAAVETVIGDLDYENPVVPIDANSSGEIPILLNITTGNQPAYVVTIES